MITIRERKLKNGKISLMLDTYVNGDRQVRSLKIYLYEKPKNQFEKNFNKENKLKAEAIRIKAENDIINNNYSIVNNDESSIRFLEYFKSIKEQKRQSLGNYGNWDSAYKILIKYFNNNDIKLSEINEDHLKNIREYLLNGYVKKSELPLSQNAASSYFNKIRICLNQAFDENLIKRNITKSVKSIKPGETKREFLTIEEVNKLSLTVCEMPTLKRSFLFSVYSGLRWSDIINLKWCDIQHTESGYFIRYRQQKTQSFETLPIPEIAIQYLGEKAEDNIRIFRGITYSAWTNLKLHQWIMSAGINRKITFHSARHSFATILLNNGTEFHVVSKLLGHKNLKTTQIYAKVMDKSKIEAVKFFDK